MRIFAIIVYSLCYISVTHQKPWDWSSALDLTSWSISLEDAVNAVNPLNWIGSLVSLFNVNHVAGGVKSHTDTEFSCIGCTFGVSIMRNRMKSEWSDDDILNVISNGCYTLGIQTAEVCNGITKLMGIDLVQAIRNSSMTSDQICSFIFQTDCPNGYDPNHDWNVTIPSHRGELSMHMTEPPLEDAPILKVLHISDFHYDSQYKEGANAECDEPLCCRENNGQPKEASAAAKKWGDYRKCDSPKILIESALKHIAETHKDIDYIIFTGDIPAHDVWNQTRKENLKIIHEANEMMRKYFPGIQIYQSIGNHETCPVDSYAPTSAPENKNMSWLYDELDKEWSHWLPSETSETIRRGAFYSALMKPGFRIISVNGNYCHKNNFWLLRNSTDPVGQLAWLVQELETAEAKGERVHIIGHMSPGQPDCLKVWARNYYDIINRFEAIIMAQFFGHTHYDEFELFYDNKDFKRPLGVGYMAPSITPWENVNPGYRIYYVDGDHPRTTRAIVDHETWKMNLDEANADDNPVWQKAYTARQAYGLTSLLPKDWDDLITRMEKDDSVFDLYYRNYYRDSPVRPACDSECRKQLICDLRTGSSKDREHFCRKF